MLKHRNGKPSPDKRDYRNVASSSKAQKGTFREDDYTGLGSVVGSDFSCKWPRDCILWLLPIGRSPHAGTKGISHGRPYHFALSYPLATRWRRDGCGVRS